MTAAEDKRWWPTGAGAGKSCRLCLPCRDAKADAGEGDHPGQGQRALRSFRISALSWKIRVARPSCKMQRLDLRSRRSACRSLKGWKGGSLASRKLHKCLAPCASQVLQVPATGARGGADCRACNMGLRSRHPGRSLGSHYHLPADRGPCTLVSPRCGGRQGQQIVAINGVDVATMTQQEHCHRGAWHLRCQLQRSDTACTVPCTLQEFRAALKARPLTLRQFGQSRLLQFLMSSCCGAGSESPTILRRHAV